MSSIRPLATITVLAFVGVFLYMKINETEPPLPAGVDDWSVGTDIQFDMGGTASTTGSQISMAPTGAQAPAFQPSAPVPPSSAPSTAPTLNPDAAAAPAWAPPPTQATPPAEVAEAPKFDPVAAAPANPTAPAIPNLPPMPALPAAASTTLPVAESTVPELPQDLDLTNVTGGNTSPATAQPASTPAPEVPNVSDITPTPPDATQAQSSLFSATRLAVHAALDRGELSQALLLLSDSYGDPSLSATETAEVNELLSQLAGSVIYSTEHRLEPPYMVQAGERLETIAEKYDVPWQLLAKINGITSADQLQPGQKLKVVRGPFSALIDISKQKMTLMLDRRYAGKFALDIDPSVTVEAGHWRVNQKLLTPANAGLPGGGPTTPTEERSLTLSNTADSSQQAAILRGAVATNPLTEPAGRVLRLSPQDAADVFDILSLGSKVVIRR